MKLSKEKEQKDKQGSTTHYTETATLGFCLWYLTPFSIIFQLYRGGQFY